MGGRGGGCTLLKGGKPASWGGSSQIDLLLLSEVEVGLLPPVLSSVYMVSGGGIGIGGWGWERRWMYVRSGLKIGVSLRKFLSWGGWVLPSDGKWVCYHHCFQFFFLGGGLEGVIKGVLYEGAEPAFPRGISQLRKIAAAARFRVVCYHQQYLGVCLCVWVSVCCVCVCMCVNEWLFVYVYVWVCVSECRLCMCVSEFEWVCMCVCVCLC